MCIRDRNLAGSLTANRKKNDVVPTNSLPRVTYTYGIDEVPQQQPENVTLTYDEAVQLCQQEIEQLWHLQASEMKLETTIVESRIYQFQRKNGQILWGEPITLSLIHICPSFIAAWRFSLDEKVCTTRASVRPDALAHALIASATSLQEICSSSQTTTFTALQLLYGDITILILQA